MKCIKSVSIMVIVIIIPKKDMSGAPSSKGFGSDVRQEFRAQIDLIAEGYILSASQPKTVLRRRHPLKTPRAGMKCWPA